MVGAAMFKKKYLEDYVMEEYINDKGRVKNRPVYIGGYFTLSPKLSARDKLLIPIAAILSIAAIVCAFIPVTLSAMLWYVVVPFVFNMLPLYYVIASAVTLYFEKEPMTREKSDRIVKRLPIGSLITTLLSAASFIGLIVAIFTSGEYMVTADILFAALVIFILAASVFTFLKCKDLKSDKVRTDVVKTHDNQVKTDDNQVKLIDNDA